MHKALVLIGDKVSTVCKSEGMDLNKVSPKKIIVGILNPNYNNPNKSVLFLKF